MKSLFKYIFLLGFIALSTVGNLSASTDLSKSKEDYRLSFQNLITGSVQCETVLSDEISFYYPSEREQAYDFLLEEKYEEENDDESKSICAKIISTPATVISTCFCALSDSYFHVKTLPALQYRSKTIDHRYRILENFRL